MSDEQFGYPNYKRNLIAADTFFPEPADDVVKVLAAWMVDCAIHSFSNSYRDHKEYGYLQEKLKKHTDWLIELIAMFPEQVNIWAILTLLEDIGGKQGITFDFPCTVEGGMVCSSYFDIVGWANHLFRIAKDNSTKSEVNDK